MSMCTRIEGYLDGYGLGTEDLHVLQRSDSTHDGVGQDLSIKFSGISYP